MHHRNPLPIKEVSMFTYALLNESVMRQNTRLVFQKVFFVCFSFWCRHVFKALLHDNIFIHDVTRVMQILQKSLIFHIRFKMPHMYFLYIYINTKLQFNNFKVYKSVILSTMSCSHHCYLVLEIFRHSKWKLYTRGLGNEAFIWTKLMT